MLRSSLRIPLRFLRGSYLRLSLTVVALACSVALVCALDLVNRAVVNAFDQIIDTMAGRAALQVDVEDGGWFAEDLADVIAPIPGVERAVPVVTATAFAGGGGGEAIAVHAFELTDSDAVAVYSADDEDEPLLDDALVFLNQLDSILVTHEFARRHRLEVDSTLALDTATGRQTFTVRGLLEPQGIARAYGGNLIVMDIGGAQHAFTRPAMVNRIDVVVRRDADVAGVAKAIAAIVPPGLRIGTPAQRKADLQTLMGSLQTLLQTLGWIALAAAFLIAFNRLSAIFEERSWQLGVLRAQGARRSVVCVELLKEGLILGALGVAIGVPLGVGLGRAILPVIAATTALNYRTVAPEGALDLRWPSFALAAGMGLSAAVSAALLPAWRASGISVAATVHGRGQELPDRRGGRIAMARWVVACAAGGAIVTQWLTRDPRWGLAATLLLVIAAAMMARPLLRSITSVMLGPLRERLGAVGSFVWLGVARRPRRIASAVAMVAVGLAAVVWLSLVAHSFERTTLAVFEQAMRADLVVSSAHIGGGSLEMPIDEKFGDVLRRVAGVRSVVGIRLTNWVYGDGPIVLDAFDPEYFRDPEFGRWPLLHHSEPGVWETVAAGRAVVVSSNFAQNLGVAVGDTIRLDTPRGPLPLQIAAITTDFASPRGTIEMSRATYARYWNDPNVTRFFVETVDPSKAADVRAGIAAALGGTRTGWRIISSAELVAYWGEQVRRAFASVYVLAAVIFVVILFGLADNIGASVVERSRELGMLRALGLRRRGTGRVMLLESLVITLLGVILALGIGAAIGLLWVTATIPYLLGWVIDLHIPLPALIATAASTVIAGLLAALVPGRRAARLHPAVALRSE